MKRKKRWHVAFPGGTNGKELAFNGGDAGSNPGSGRSPGEGNGYHSMVEFHGQRSMWVTVHGVVKRWTQLTLSHFPSNSDRRRYVGGAEGGTESVTKC